MCPQQPPLFDETGDVFRGLFLAERRLPGLTEADRRAVERALIEASRRVSQEGTPVRYVRSSYVAVEQRWLGLFASNASETVNRVFGIAQVPDGSVIQVTEGAPAVGGTPGSPDVTPRRPERW